MYQLIEKLLEKNKKENIFFFSFDDNFFSIEEVIESYKEFQNKDLREEKCYIFLDEIQKCRNWENSLKKYYDLYPKLKFVISSSESLFVKKKTKETLAGRIFEIFLKPFSFKEFVLFKGKKEMKYETEIKPLFLEYINKGGFPESFSLNEKKFDEYIKSLVVDKIVYKDIPKLFRIEDPDLVKILLEIISTNPGVYIDYQSLAKQLGRDRRVIKNYIFYLENSFLIKLLGNYRKTKISTLRKRKKAYPTDISLIKIYKKEFGDEFLGKIIETLIVNHLDSTFFWTEKSEVDIVKDEIPIEIKYQNKIDDSDFKGLIDFMKKFDKKEGILISKNEEKEIFIKDKKIQIIPAWKFLLGF